MINEYIIKSCLNKDECFCVRDFEEKRRNEFFQEKIQKLEKEVERLKGELLKAREYEFMYKELRKEHLTL